MDFDQENERHGSKANKTTLFRQKLKPIENPPRKEHVGGSSTMSNDELTKLSVEKSIHSPLLAHADLPVRDTKNPARFKNSVMKVKVPLSHEKFKAVVVPQVDVQA